MEKRSREKIAEVDGKLLKRGYKFGGGYQPLEDRRGEEENQQQPETFEDNEQESEGETQLIQGDNFPIVVVEAYDTEGKEDHFIRTNQVIDKTTGDKWATEDASKKTEFKFMRDLKTLNAK